MATSGDVCYGAMCEADSFCDPLSKFCYKCTQWLHTCFTEKHIPRCTHVCKEMMNHIPIQLPGTTMVATPEDVTREPDSTTFLTILYVMAATVVVLLFALFIIVCFYKKIGFNKPIMVIRKNIYRLLNFFNIRHNDQTFVKQHLTYCKTPRAKNNDQADASLFADRLSVTSLLSEQESRSFPSLYQITEIPIACNPRPPANPETPQTSSESTTHPPTAYYPGQNNDNISHGNTDYYQISKPIKEVGDEGLSIHVDGHVLKPREIQPGQNGRVNSTRYPEFP